MIDKKILSNFNNIRLTLNQFQILRSLYRQTKKHSSEEPQKDDDECFQKQPDLEYAGMKEFTGIVPEQFLILVNLGFIDLMKSDSNLNEDEDITKSYILTPTGIMFYVYYRERLVFNYLTLIIAILSFIFSIITFIFTS